MPKLCVSNNIIENQNEFNQDSKCFFYIDKKIYPINKIDNINLNSNKFSWYASDSLKSSNEEAWTWNKVVFETKNIIKNDSTFENRNIVVSVFSNDQSSLINIETESYFIYSISESAQTIVFSTIEYFI